jgi:hypothetical protein
MTEEELDHMKGIFTNVAGNDAGATLLAEATEDPAAAGADILEAKKKVRA